MDMILGLMVGYFAIATGTLGSALGVAWACYRGRSPGDRVGVLSRPVAAGIAGAGMGAVAGFLGAVAGFYFGGAGVGNGPEFTWWGGKLNILTAADEIFLLAGLVAVGVSAFGTLWGSKAEPSSLTIRGVTSNALFLASIVSYVAALFNIAIKGGEELSGLHALILGPLGLLFGEFSWLANIFLWGAWLKRKKPKTLPVALAILALIVAGTSLLGYLVIPGRSRQDDLVGPGYWLWLASMVLAGASALIYVQPSAKVQSGAA